jgi:hypothetical protein
MNPDMLVVGFFYLHGNEYRLTLLTGRDRTTRLRPTFVRCRSAAADDNSLSGNTNGTTGVPKAYSRATHRQFTVRCTHSEPTATSFNPTILVSFTVFVPNRRLEKENESSWTGSCPDGFGPERTDSFDCIE